VARNSVSCVKDTRNRVSRHVV